MTDDEFEIHEQAPVDEEGHPIHPEKGHRICGADKSPRSTPAPHGRSRDDYAYCLLPAGWGTDSSLGSCKNHPYSGSQIGSSNPNYKTGAYSVHMRSDLTESEEEAFDDLVDALQDPDETLDAVRELAAEGILKYKRSGDYRFLREARQLLDTFNLAPNEDRVALDAQVESEHSLDDATKDVVRDVLARRRSAEGESDE